MIKKLLNLKEMWKEMEPTAREVQSWEAVLRAVYWLERGVFLVLTFMPRPVLGVLYNVYKRFCHFSSSPKKKVTKIIKVEILIKNRILAEISFKILILTKNQIIMWITFKIPIHMMIDTWAGSNLIKQQAVKTNVKINKFKCLKLIGINKHPAFTLGEITINIFGCLSTLKIIPNEVPIKHDGILGTEFFETTTQKLIKQKNNLK